MRHIFIINPAAGKGKIERTLLPRIIETSKKLGIDYEIHRTMAPGEAEKFIKRMCKNRDTEGTHGFSNDSIKDILRFYACGGDGTLNEVINGAYGHQNIEVAMIPAGTGNDFPRNFNSVNAFDNIEGQILGHARPIDIIRYQQTTIDACTAQAQRYGVNMFNIGLDSNVVELAGKLKAYPFVPISLAYLLGVVIVLGKKESVNLEICFDDGEIHRGNFMLIAIGNGAYCGGGYKGVPDASVYDNLIDVSIVKEISRFTLVSFLNKYKAGTHLKDPSTADFIIYKKSKGLTISSKKAVRLSSDGEISTVRQANFEIVPCGINFSVPLTCESI